MPQPRDRQQPQQDRNRQSQSSNKQDIQKSDKHSNPDRYPDQGKRAQKPSEVRYPEQDPSGKAERPDAVDGADVSQSDRGKRDRDLN